MFGREKGAPARDQAAETSAPATDEAPLKVGGKGRATPSRREAEARNHRPIIGAAPPPASTKEERKAQKAARNEALRTERAVSRQGLMNGDERYLPARDKGPARRWVRDYIDARRNLGEFFLPIALVSILVGFVNVPAARYASLGLLYVMVLAIVVDGLLLNRRLKRLVRDKFGEKHAPGVGMYGVMRSMQIRRARMPKPMVGRGQFPR